MANLVASWKRQEENFQPVLRLKQPARRLKSGDRLGESPKRFEVHPLMISKWKQEFIEHSAEVFEKKKGDGDEVDVDKLYNCRI